MLIMGVILFFGLPMMLALSGNAKALFDPRILFWYNLPVLVGTAFLYDHNPKRRGFYLWGGAAAIVFSLIIILR